MTTAWEYKKIETMIERAVYAALERQRIEQLKREEEAKYLPPIDRGQHKGELL